MPTLNRCRTIAELPVLAMKLIGHKGTIVHDGNKPDRMQCKLVDFVLPSMSCWRLKIGWKKGKRWLTYSR